MGTPARWFDAHWGCPVFHIWHMTAQGTPLDLVSKDMRYIDILGPLTPVSLACNQSSAEGEENTDGGEECVQGHNHRR